MLCDPDGLKTSQNELDIRVSLLLGNRSHWLSDMGELCTRDGVWNTRASAGLCNVETISAFCLPPPPCVCMCVRTCRRSEVNLFLDAASLLFESESLVGTWGLLFRLDWLLREPQGFACAYLPRTVISGAHL